MKRGLLVLSLMALFVPSLAHGLRGPVPPPTLVEGQQVYTVPEGFAPPGVGLPGIQQLNGELNRLHYPFKVVFVEALPTLTDEHWSDARSKGIRGDRDSVMIEYSTAALATDWAETQPNLWNASTDTVFVLSFDPRKFAWVAGGDRRTRLRLEGKEALAPFEAHFIAAVRREPKDPVGGIGNLARAFDEHVFDQTDPERIAARAEANRKAEQALRLRKARGALDEQIMRLSGLLEDPEYLPPDVEAYRALLEKAKVARTGDDPPTMLAMAGEMAPSTDVLDSFVGDAKAKAFWAAAGRVAELLLLLGAMATIILLFRRRLNRLGELRRRAEEALVEWEAKISNAHQRWMDHYLAREDVIGLDGVTGRTKELFDEVTGLVDGLLISIQAMDQHVKACRALAAKGGFFRLQPFEQALDKLTDPFEFNTEKVNKSDLFGGETQVITVSPEKFAANMKASFEKAVKGWDRLKEAANFRLQSAADRIPHNTLTKLFERATALGVPHQWFDKHPLYGDEASDQTFYQQLDTLRQADPLAYEDNVQAVLEQEQGMVRLMDELEECDRMVQQARIEALPNPEGTRVAPEDDPQRTLAAAWHAEHEFKGLLASSRDPKALLKAAEQVVNVYGKARKQHGQLVAAVKDAAGKVKAVGEATRAATADIQLVIEEIKAAEAKHAHADKATSFVQDAERALSLAHRARASAEKALEASEHLDAKGDAAVALTRCEEAQRAVGKARSHLERLDRDRREFKTRAGVMDSVYADAQRKMKGYGSHGRSLAAPQIPSDKGVVDYAALTRTIEAQMEAWEAEQRRARQSYDQEQRRIREEQERQERQRREAEEAERRRRSSYHSTYHSSSSSGSFGGGGFGGSSGSCGGGGFGGSSGSW